MLFKLIKHVSFITREIGSDMPSNELILRKDTIVDIGVIGVLATLGKHFIRVYK